MIKWVLIRTFTSFSLLTTKEIYAIIPTNVVYITVHQVGAYVLNFNGRVTMASVKNFQLVDPDDQKAVVLQFGKVSRDEYTMDMQWPITPFQAFAVTLSSFDLKIACDWELGGSYEGELKILSFTHLMLLLAALDGINVILSWLQID